jgi:hypothetical protein
MARLRPAIVLVLAAAALGIGACGSDDDDQDGPERAAGDPARYCALVAALDRRGQRVFAALERDDDASPAEFEAAERRFVTEAANDLAALRRAAPAALRDDVATFVEAMRGRGGLDDAPPSEARASAAEKRLRAYDERTCGR